MIVQRTFEFMEKNNKKVTDNVSVDVKDNYVQYHMKDEDSELWVIEDFNRVSVVGFTSTFSFYKPSTVVYYQTRVYQMQPRNGQNM